MIEGQGTVSPSHLALMPDDRDRPEGKNVCRMRSVFSIGLPQDRAGICNALLCTCRVEVPVSSQATVRPGMPASSPSECAFEYAGRATSASHLPQASGRPSMGARVPVISGQFGAEPVAPVPMSIEFASLAERGSMRGIGCGRQAACLFVLWLGRRRQFDGGRRCPISFSRLGREFGQGAPEDVVLGLR